MWGERGLGATDVYSRWRPGIPLNIHQWIGQPFTTKNDPAPNVSIAKAEKPWLG